MKRTMVMKTVAVLGVASLALAACSSGEETATESATAAESAAETAVEEAETAVETAEEAAAAECQNPSALIVGSLLPATGNLAFLGPPEFAGVEKAIAEIDAAGGVLGAPVTYIEGDSGDTSTDIASQTSDSHIAQGVQAIIGAASSGVTLTVIDKITSNGVVMMSPANTAPNLTTYPDNDLYWRVAPSDVLQGAVIAASAIDAGVETMGVIARQDAYGEGLAAATAKDFAAAGGTVTSEILYDGEAASFEAEVAEIKAGGPQAVAVIGFEETTRLLQEMIKQGVGPKDLQVYLVDGNISTTAYADFPKGTMKGVVATVPTGEADLTAFNESLLEVDPALTDFAYGAQAYDATILLALAAAKAGCADGTSIAAELANVAGNGGEACTTYADCIALLAAGTDIDFNGVTGALDFNQYGDPATATIQINEFSSNTEFAEIGRVTAEVPLP
ncbi:MAG: ABC transporter substrate-binding protein [Candidatus Nanopelagicales bacterium]|jgi:ABC-type branched-subunit amino acid transport system substrate-binding protein|nr:ABC transporter substrate-binding protein [Candidatus Nanopelagicales bacterium]